MIYWWSDDDENGNPPLGQFVVIYMNILWSIFLVTLSKLYINFPRTVRMFEQSLAFWADSE